MQGASKKGLPEKHLRHITIEKYIFSELNRWIFQISLKYINYSKNTVYTGIMQF